jgi:hypothetical protein
VDVGDEHRWWDLAPSSSLLQLRAVKDWAAPVKNACRVQRSSFHVLAGGTFEEKSVASKLKYKRGHNTRMAVGSAGDQADLVKYSANDDGRATAGGERSRVGGGSSNSSSSSSSICSTSALFSGQTRGVEFFEEDAASVPNDLGSEGFPSSIQNGASRGLRAPASYRRTPFRRRVISNSGLQKRVLRHITLPPPSGLPGGANIPMIEEGIRHQADPCRVNRLSESLRRSYCAWSDSDAATRFAKIGGRLYCQHEVSKSGNSSNYQTHRHRHLAQSAINECRQCGADGVTCDRLGDQTQEKEQYQSSNVSRLAPSEVRRPILLRSSGLSKLFHWQYCKIVREKCLEESTTWIGNLIDSVQPQSTSLISVARLFDLHSILPKSERASQPPINEGSHFMEDRPVASDADGLGRQRPFRYAEVGSDVINMQQPVSEATRALAQATAATYVQNSLYQAKKDCSLNVFVRPPRDLTAGLGIIASMHIGLYSIYYDRSRMISTAYSDAYSTRRSCWAEESYGDGDQVAMWETALAHWINCFRNKGDRTLIPGTVSHRKADHRHDDWSHVAVQSCCSEEVNIRLLKALCLWSNEMGTIFHHSVDLYEHLLCDLATLFALLHIARRRLVVDKKNVDGIFLAVNGGSLLWDVRLRYAQLGDFADCHRDICHCNFCARVERGCGNCTYTSDVSIPQVLESDGVSAISVSCMFHERRNSSRESTGDDARERECECFNCMAARWHETQSIDFFDQYRSFLRLTDILVSAGSRQFALLTNKVLKYAMQDVPEGLALKACRRLAQQLSNECVRCSDSISTPGSDYNLDDRYVQREALITTIGHAKTYGIRRQMGIRNGASMSTIEDMGGMRVLPLEDIFVHARSVGSYGLLSQ